MLSLASRSKEAVAEVPPSEQVDALTVRETEVLLLIAKGLSNKQIAQQLVLTEGTVKLHLHHIYGKLQAKAGFKRSIKRREEAYSMRMTAVCPLL